MGGYRGSDVKALEMYLEVGVLVVRADAMCDVLIVLLPSCSFRFPSFFQVKRLSKRSPAVDFLSGSFRYRRSGVSLYYAFLF